ncbi:hypothetical protein BKI49_01190 [Streptomyces sp. Tue6028]|uniref:hypothetical protein n=1 Tax=Streptomyces sp. Tue6028 TaxID=2036037 RepID=UPI000BB39A2B|nr:hypothetical protein BKI49_01190 [Streptomyces sp. Tue6028]
MGLFLRTSADSPAAPADPVGRARGTAACSRSGRHVVADTHWRARTGHWYLLAAGSRAVTRIDVGGDVTARANGRTLAVRAARDARTRVTARLDTGASLEPVGDGAGR